MSSKKHEEHKKMGVQRFFNSIKYSIEGLVHAYANEQSLWLHGFYSIIAIILGICFRIRFYEWAVILVAFVVVLAVELLNTAIEAVVDLVTSEFHPLAKVAKDCGSAAAFVSSIVTLFICIYVFLPKILALF